MAPGESRRKNRDRERHPHTHRAAKRKSRVEGDRPRKSRQVPASEASGSQALSADSLARLNLINQHEESRTQRRDPHRAKRKRHVEVPDEKFVVEKRRQQKKKKRRVVSGAMLEEGDGERLRGIRGGRGDYNEKQEYRADERQRKKIWIGAGIAIVLLIIIIAVAVTVSKKNSTNATVSSGPVLDESGKPANANLNGVSPDTVPAAAKGTYLDPFSWYDTSDFNTTYTNDTVGGLPLIGLFSTWDDSKRANEKTPPINKAWGSYDTLPARGVNLGGWLSLEPFITPSLFNYDSRLGIIDEYTLTSHLGPSEAASTLEKHYATFVSEQTFKDIADAGLDHVRIPFSYWAIAVYENDPYVFRTSWRYLLRGIEWARKHGLRVNLDVHGLPGSQNGWNHSGRQGAINWLSGANGAENAQRSLEMHDQLSKFFAQPRYKNIIAFYGLCNEPKMTSLKVEDVENWTGEAHSIIRNNGIAAYIVFGDGFMGLENWQGKLQSYDGLVLDVHQYVIFNKDQIAFPHSKKVSFACEGWTQQSQISMNRATGFGPTIVAEWSQADTDCALHLTNVGFGNRWEGTYKSVDGQSDVLTPGCPTKDRSCSCAQANADPSTYSAEYKKFLQMFAEAQMKSFEEGWGWFYWTWETESAAQWSYKAGLAAGILPKKAYEPEFKCNAVVPEFAPQLPENY